MNETQLLEKGKGNKRDRPPTERPGDRAPAAMTTGTRATATERGVIQRHMQMRQKKGGSHARPAAVYGSLLIVGEGTTVQQASSTVPDIVDQ